MRVSGLAAICLLLESAAFAVTNHVVILVMDGARYSETMGDTTHANVPRIAALARQGVTLTGFRTAATGSIAESWTETCPGHARITTGTYQNIANNGSELPTQPGIFQHFIRHTGARADTAWLVCSKDKLFILGNSSAAGWHNQDLPASSCGASGTGSGGYREDNQTQGIVLQKLIADRPALMLVNYKGPDAMAHGGDWNGYLAAIREVDGYAGRIWDTVQADPILRNATALFIVNDHGRHSTDFTSHGDACLGCRSIMCVALGPDIVADSVCAATREQIDLAPTIARMMNFTVPTAAGAVMSEILTPPTLVSGWTAGAAVQGMSVAVDGGWVRFANVPRGAALDVFSLSGARVARLAADPTRGTVVWRAPAGARYVCRLAGATAPSLVFTAQR